MNRLSPAETERYAKATEENGEIGQALGKLLAYGRTSENEGNAYSNIGDLEREIGDFFGVIDMMVAAGDLNLDNITKARIAKLNKLPRYLNEQPSALLMAMYARAKELERGP
jgi:hypothetical protein